MLTPPDRIIQQLVEVIIASTEPDERSPHIRGVLEAGVAWLNEFNAPRPPSDELPNRIKRKPCRTCGEWIWFAMRPNLGANGQPIWVPMCPFSVRDDLQILDAYNVNLTQIDAPTIMPLNEGGLQWFPHSVFCGLKDRPRDPAMARIWDKTTGRGIGREDEAVEGLLKLLEE